MVSVQTTTMRTIGVTAAAMKKTSMTSQRETGGNWYVLACDGGYIANEFELYNGTARRPRLTVVDDLQRASVYPSHEDSWGYWKKLAREVLGVESRLMPIRFHRPRKEQDTQIALIKESSV